MGKYRGNHHRPIHPKIFIWSHTEKAEIEYFQDFKNHLKTPLLMPKKEICWTPQELIEKVIKWKKENVSDKDKDEVWCIFDVDDFYQKDKENFLKIIEKAHKNNVKIAYINECFELWIILHFEKPTSPISRGKSMEEKIQALFKKNKLGSFQKNQKIFEVLLPFQSTAIENSKKLLSVEYGAINWQQMLDRTGNPSTSFHFLVEGINHLLSE
ncbi:MAG: RloB family protein [Candidatus Gracilibacteria bacterium]|nr:RloB family protein [Candidatus Gracilibacteria bacterium]